jgi:hypothetical protein
MARRLVAALLAFDWAIRRRAGAVGVVVVAVDSARCG